MRRKQQDLSRNWVGVCLTPALIDQFEVSDAVVVVIDVLRATTSMCAAFDNGARTMTPVVTIEEARSYMAQGMLGAGERGGVQVDGFDFGNSPFSYMAQDIRGKDIVITTTNGTLALNAAKDLKAKDIVIGSFANLSVLTEFLVKRNENVLLLCAGYQERPNLEDTIFAGAMVRRLRPWFRILEDSAIIAETLYRNANRRKRWYIRNSSHFNRLVHLRIQKDVKYSLRPDTHPVIPILQGETLYRIEDLPEQVEEPVLNP